MKVYYKKSVAARIHEKIHKAAEDGREIDYIILTPLEWDQLLAEDRPELSRTVRTVFYHGVWIRKET